MSPSSFEKAIRLQFDCLIRKVIDRTVKNYYRELGRRAKHEVPFCDVTEVDLNHVATIDEYSMGYTVFPVYGTEVRVFDEHLCEAIKTLSERQRTIVLMSYFLEMSDIEIGEIIGISRCSVYRSRMRALNIIREKIRRISKMERIQKCPRFSTICLAVDGDEIAMEKILNHYNAYISKACLRPCYDEYGNMRIVVDMDLKGRVRTTIMKAILNFELEIK